MKKYLLPAVYLIIGIAVLLGMFDLASMLTANNKIPIPSATKVLGTLFSLWSDPFYDNGPNDKGIGFQLLTSLGTVFKGFLLATLIALPVGYLIGSSKIIMSILNPIIQVLRPVSPLAWFPLGLALFEASDKAAVFAVFITCIWPTLINTALGVASVPADHKNVGKAFGFSKWKTITKIYFPYSLSYIFTGLKLSIGIAWVVIVAAEMLSGGAGVGFFVWDSWNASSLEKVIAVILTIGVVGLLLDKAFTMMQKKFSYVA
ncbi:nitrate ABC transporter permease [Ferruginibacter sp. SUN002]|uniref:nitrate ABC transporter permease n=1 Tax=Ferruginibacter sp. SUN002 TaxID=2937789 RepID=UPI003D368B99